MNKEQLELTTLETTSKIMNLDDVSINTRILLYYFASMFTVLDTDSIQTNFEDIEKILSMSKENTLEQLSILKLKKYIEHNEDTNIISLTPKTLSVLK